MKHYNRPACKMLFSCACMFSQQFVHKVTTPHARLLWKMNWCKWPLGCNREKPPAVTDRNPSSLSLTLSFSLSLSLSQSFYRHTLCLMHILSLTPPISSLTHSIGLSLIRSLSPSISSLTHSIGLLFSLSLLLHVSCSCSYDFSLPPSLPLSLSLFPAPISLAPFPILIPCLPWHKMMCRVEQESTRWGGHWHPFIRTGAHPEYCLLLGAQNGAWEKKIGKWQRKG